MKTVRDLLQNKRTNFVETIEPEASVFDAVSRMTAKNVGSLVVTVGEQVVGIFSEKDYCRKITLANRSPRSTRVGDAMQPRVLYIESGDSLASCMHLMTEKRVRHLPVIDRDQLVGIVSIGDLIHAAIADQEFEIEPPTRYIVGPYFDDETDYRRQPGPVQMPEQIRHHISLKDLAGFEG